MANAIVTKAKYEDIHHDEMHESVQYIVAHGIASMVDDKRVIIGSEHFVFDDEKVYRDEKIDEIINNLPKAVVHIFI